MVAISLYRGNLHRVSHVTQKWQWPKDPISFKEFSRLLRKRHRSLSRVHHSTTITTIANPNPNPNPKSEDREEEVVGENGCSDKQKQGQVSETPDLQSQEPVSAVLPEENNNVGDSNEVENQSVREEVRGDGDGGADGTLQAVAEEGQEGSGKPDSELKNNVEVSSDKDKRKKELEQKLQHLNEKKHNMVQMLKQILHAEEEMKKRNSMPAAVVLSPNPSQVETMNDVGANPKHAINRMGSEGNSSVDLEGESEDASNHTAHARHLQQMSPSASSPLRRPSHGSLQHHAVPHTTRPSLGTSGHSQTTSTHMGVTASPSRFAPFGHQSHSAGLPPLATSGTPFTASSPSPAASGGTSVFRDHRWTSPTWN